MTLEIGYQLQQGRYAIQQVLGQGGMGTVYLAADRNLPGRFVAIKENADATQTAQEQFQHEAIMLARLTHPNLPRVTDHFIESSGLQYLVMDYVEGDDLRDLLRQQRGPLPEPMVLDWIGQVMNALEHMHNWIDPATRRPTPVIHRDIKPGNIKRTPNGRVVLVDFGLAKYEEHDEGTVAGARAFTSGYSPVEQYTGGTNVRSDIYALGATLYALVTGQKPPDSPVLAAGTRLTPPRQLNPQLSRNTERVILRAMQVQGADRYQTIAAMRDALLNRRSLVTGENQSPHQAEYVLSTYQRRAPQRRGGLFIWSLGLLLIGVIAVGLLLSAPNRWPWAAQWMPQRQPTATTLMAAASTVTASSAAIPTQTLTLPPSPSPTITPTATGTLVGSASITSANFVTNSVTSSVTATLSTSTPLIATVTSTVTPTVTAVPDLPSATPTLIPAIPTATPSATANPTASPSATPTAKATATATKPATATNTPTNTPPATPTPTAIPTVTASPVPSPTSIATPKPTATATVTATVTPAPTPTYTPTVLPTATSTSTRRPTLTYTPTVPPTAIATATPLPSSTATATVTLTHTATPRPPTATATATNTVTNTATPKATATPKPTNTPTATPTPAPPVAGEVRKNPRDQALYVFVPGGEFHMGSEIEPDEMPLHMVAVASFWIGQSEVTNAQYARCVDAGACTAPRNNEWTDAAKANYPVTYVDWSQASAYAAWIGGRLPTEAEWEKAAHGTDDRNFPWGDEMTDDQRLNFNSPQGPVAVGSYPAGASPYGALDMAGNVEEWVADWYAPDYYSQSPSADPPGPTDGRFRVVRGGSYNSSRGDVRTTKRGRALPNSAFPGVGFRVAIPKL